MQHLRVGAAGSLLLAALAAASCGDPEEQIVPAVYELCTDGVDGDEDGLVDCDDPDCDAEPACLCGNGVCDMEAGEPTTCPLDCPMGCGDGVCAGPETPALCPADCPDPCGDGVCDPATENQQNCLADCEGVANCGNGVVEGDEECDGLTGLSTCGALNPPRGQGDGLSCSNTCEVVNGCGLAMCSTAGTNTMAYSGTISCADVTNELRWDIFEVPVMAGDCVYIRLDNAGLGNADLRATVFDANGTTFFGGAEDYSELDDEWACTNTPWFSAGGCPERSIVAETTGNLRVGVTQWAGGCATDPSDYQLDVAVNGTDVDLSAGPVATDTPMFP